MKKIKINQFLTLLILILFIPILFFSSSEKDELIAKVSGSKVYQNDINYKKNTALCYGETLTDDLAFIGMTNDILEYEVLKSYFNFKVGRSMLKEKSLFIDKTTKAPEILDCVKEVFKKDTENYNKIFIMPTLVNQIVRDLYYYDENLHKDSTKKIREIQKEIYLGKEIESYEEYSEFEVQKEVKNDEVSEKYDLTYKENPLLKIAKELKPDEVWENIGEEKKYYIIPRLLSEDEEKYYLDGIIIQKKEFDAWYKDYVLGNIKITVYDEEVRSRLTEDYPKIFWIESINL